MSKSSAGDSYFLRSIVGLGYGVAISKLLAVVTFMFSVLCQYLPVGTISNQMFSVASQLTYPIISISIAHCLNVRGISLLSIGLLGAICSLHPSVGALLVLYVATLISIKVCEAVKNKTSFDLFLIPICIMLVAYITLTFISPYIDKGVNMIFTPLFKSVNFSMPIMATLVSSTFSVLSSLPIEISKIFSSSIFFSPYSLTAATCGLMSMLLGLGVMSLEANKVGEGLAICLSTPLLQLRNIIKNPLIVLPPILAGICSSLISIQFLNIYMNYVPGNFVEVYNYMTTCANPLMSFVGFILLPLFFSFTFFKLLRKLNWIKYQDLTLPKF